MALSGSSNFANATNIDKIVTDAYERCGIAPDAITGQQTNSAILSTNLILQQWANDGLMLSTVQKCMLQLNVGQPNYYLPTGTIELLEVTATNVVRQGGGTPFSSAGGDAANAFSGLASVACTQTSPNGYISYQWPNSPSIYYVGIQANVTTTYSIIIEYSFSGGSDSAEWFTALDTYTNQYIIGQVLWWVIPSPINAPFLRIRAYNGGTLDIQQIYFDTPQSTSRLLAPVSRETWMSYANKITRAQSGTYYLDKSEIPNVTFYPTPDNSYTNIVYTRKRQIYDATLLNQNIDLKQIFYKAFVSNLAADLAVKFAPDRYQLLKSIADADFMRANQEDVQDVPIYVYPNLYASFGVS